MAIKRALRRGKKKWILAFELRFQTLIEQVLFNFVRVLICHWAKQRKKVFNSTFTVPPIPIILLFSKLEYIFLLFFFTSIVANGMERMWIVFLVHVCACRENSRVRIKCGYWRVLVYIRQTSCSCIRTAHADGRHSSSDSRILNEKKKIGFQWQRVCEPADPPEEMCLQIKFSIDLFSIRNLCFRRFLINWHLGEKKYCEKLFSLASLVNCMHANAKHVNDYVVEVSNDTCCSLMPYVIGRCNKLINLFDHFWKKIQFTFEPNYNSTIPNNIRAYTMNKCSRFIYWLGANWLLGNGVRDYLFLKTAPHEHQSFKHVHLDCYFYTLFSLKTLIIVNKYCYKYLSGPYKVENIGCSVAQPTWVNLKRIVMTDGYFKRFDSWNS